MKNFIRLSVVVGFALLQGCTPSANSSQIPSSQSVTDSPSSPSSPSGSDKYEIQWTGTNGEDFFGSYVITFKDPSVPVRVESVQAKLPHKVSFSIPKNSGVSAYGNLLHKGSVEVRIYKNARECGKVAVVGSGVGANKVCL